MRQKVTDGLTGQTACSPNPSVATIIGAGPTKGEREAAGESVPKFNDFGKTERGKGVGELTVAQAAVRGSASHFPDWRFYVTDKEPRLNTRVRFHHGL